MSKWTVAGIAAIVAVSFFVGRSFAQEDGGGAAGMKMPEWMSATEHHKELAKTCGEFDIATEMWMAPGMPVQKGAATGKREMILNGMFLQETFKMPFGGMNFEGRLTIGYDTVRKKYASTWVDSMSPAMHISFGEMKDGKLEMKGDGPDMMGKLEGKRMVIDNASADTWTVTFFDVKADGTEHMGMRMKYTRKKAE